MVVAPSFNNLLKILGGREIKVVGDTKHWNFYTLVFGTPAGNMNANYLYLASDCPISEASRTNINLWKSRGQYTVVPTTRSRLATDLDRTTKLFGAFDATTPRKLLLDNILPHVTIPSNPADNYRYFIEPEISYRVENSSALQSAQASAYIANSLVSGESSDTSSVCAEVLVAPAGQGKTTFCRQIASNIHSMYPYVIPVLVESSQWQRLIDLTLPNVLNAALLQILPGATQLTSPKVFQALVRENIFIPIFDGFDELSLHPSANTSAASLLTDLLSLIGSSGARALITVRETFWEKHITEFPRDTIKKIRRLNLQGFSNQQRQEFFQKRLSLPQERDIANRLSREIGTRLYEGALELPEKQAERASGIPLMLELIALYVDGNPNATFSPETHDPLGPLLESVCERENVRQKLDICSEKQMLIFERLFRDYPDDIPRDELALYVEELVPDVLPDTIRRFESHAFFSTTLDKSLVPRFETLKVYFLARWLAQQLAGSVGKELGENATKVLGMHASGSDDIFDYLVRIFAADSTAKAIATISHASRMVRVRPNWEGASSALFHLSQRLAHRLEKNKRERADAVIKFMMGLEASISQMVQVAMYQQVNGMDFSGVTFVDCHFDNVSFHNCNFSGATKFQRSRFIGELSFTNCTGEGCAEIDQASCKLSESAVIAWEERKGRSEKRRVISEEIAKDALREILSKFIERFGFGGIKYKDRDSGPISRSPCKDETWIALLKVGIVERHRISGVSEGGLNIVDDSDVRHEVRNYLDNAALGRRLRSVLDQVLTRSAGIA